MLSTVGSTRRDTSYRHARRQAGIRFDDNHLRVFQTIVLHEQTLGTLYIESDMRQWYARLTRYGGIVAMLMLGAALVAFAALLALAAVISGTDSRSRADDEDRVDAEELRRSARQKTQNDEIGALIDGFNTMLAEIQRRDAALQGANDDLQTRTQELEQEVTERLRAQDELKTLNTTLEQRVAERSAAAEQRADELARSKEALAEADADPPVDPRQHERRRHRRRRRRARSSWSIRPPRRCCSVQLRGAPTGDWSRASRLLPARHGHALPHR